MSFPHENLIVYQHVPTIRYAVDVEADLVWEDWQGNVSRDDLEEHWSRILENDAVMNCRRTIVDLTKATIHLGGSDLNEMIGSLVMPKLAGRQWITAIVVNSDFQFGISRQYGAYANLYSTDQIFKSVASALEWIRDRRHPG